MESPLNLVEFELDHAGRKSGEVVCQATIQVNDEIVQGTGKGNGPINAFVQLLAELGFKTFKVTDYRSQALRGGSDADSAAYVQIQDIESGLLLWGCGVDPSIEMAGLRALVSAWNLQNQTK